MSLPPHLVRFSDNLMAEKFDYSTQNFKESAVLSGRVLVVHDSPPIGDRQIQSSFQSLRSSGLEFEHVASAEAALASLSKNHFDLVIIGPCQLSCCDWTLVASIRAAYSAGALPIIAMIEEASSELVKQGFQAGVNDFAILPMEGDLFHQRIHLNLMLLLSRRALHESEERYKLAAMGSNDGLWDWDFRNQKVFLSTRCKGMLGYRDDEIENSPDELIKRIHVEDVDRLEEKMQDIIQGSNSNLDCEIRLLHRDNGYRWMICRGVAVRNADHQVYRMAGSLTDVTESRVGDPLTGLPNRLLFFDRLEQAIERYKRNPKNQYAVVFLDLDHFKKVNDSYGHHIGDQVLLEISKRLKNCIRSSDCLNHSHSGRSNTLARYAGDEFTIILEDFCSEADVEKTINRILDEMARPIKTDLAAIDITLSVGWLVGRPQMNTAEEVLRHADEAMYQSKSKGRNCAAKFHQNMQDNYKKRLQRKTEIEQGISKSEFLLNFLPIVDLSDNSIVAFEALVRWQHPLEGLLLPGDFMPIAEESGLIVSLGWHITELAAAQLAIWQAQFPDQPTKLFVNFSAKQLLERNFVERLSGVIQHTGVSANDLSFEISEVDLIEDFDRLSSIVLKIHEQGVTIGIDDFGIGRTSLTHLSQLPVHAIKIDRSLIGAMTQESQVHQLVKTMIDMADNLKIKVVAEGIETEKQRAMLAELGCKLGQGFYWSLPLSPETATKTIRLRKKRGGCFPGIPLPTSGSVSGSLF